MEERTILRRISRGSQRALEAVMRQYSAYVVTVIHNRSRGCLSAEDEEEIASDVFLSLWQHAGEIQLGHLRPWLGSVSSHKTVDRLRQYRMTVPLEEGTLVAEDSLGSSLSRREQAQKVRAALASLKPEDREIFCRYYDLCQTATQIAAAMHMQPSTVRTRLSQGRAALRDILCQGGFQYEQAD